MFVGVCHTDVINQIASRKTIDSPFSLSLALLDLVCLSFDFLLFIDKWRNLYIISSFDYNCQVQVDVLVKMDTKEDRSYLNMDNEKWCHRESFKPFDLPQWERLNCLFHYSQHLVTYVPWSLKKEDSERERGEKRSIDTRWCASLSLVSLHSGHSCKHLLIMIIIVRLAKEREHSDRN